MSALTRLLLPSADPHQHNQEDKVGRPSALNRRDVIGAAATTIQHRHDYLTSPRG